MNKKFVFVLGSNDPEMAAIEAAVTEEKHTVVYATVAGSRVHPGNAYKADPIDFGDCALTSATTVVLVECQPKYVVDSSCTLESETRDIITKVVDHHRPIDPGFGKEAEEYLAGSSLGQVLSLLGKKPTTQQQYIAAADHCLSAAYQGRCPGVDPSILLRRRVLEKAKFQERKPSSVMTEVMYAVKILRKRHEENPCRLPHFFDPIPQMPEASALTGIPFTAMVEERGGRKKIVLQGADAKTIRSWMDQYRSEGFEVYGDPVRGFAGAYVKA